LATPDISREDVQAFCQDHFLAGLPRYVLVQVANWALPAECFPNVATMVKKKGGKLVLGWHLWEIPGLLLEAEYHCVWEKPSGILVDITPQRPGYEEERILFVPRRKDRLGKNPPDNIRRPLSNDEDIALMCNLKEQYVKLSAQGEPEGTPGHYRLPIDVARRIEVIMAEHQTVMARLTERYPDRFKA